MLNCSRLLTSSLLLGLIAFSSGCVAPPPPPHEGYYDHDHNRYYHQGGWHPCAEHDPACGPPP